MDIASSVAGTRRILVLAAVGVCAAACSSSGSTPAAQPTSPAGGQTSAAAGQTSAAAAPSGAPAAKESPPPGDIPDTTVYVAYSPASGQYQVKVPEGWARTVTPADVSFTDKLNTITIRMVRTATAPTPTMARAAEVPQIQSSAHSFALTGISTVSRSAGPVVLIRYSTDSQPDPVTGKVFTDAIERYEFYRNGTEAVVILSGPAGADNVDPWRTVTDSFRWLR
jgi:hypothetical protein